MSYIEIIKHAIIVCPLIAFLLSGIYFIIQYRKYGSVSIFRTFILYTFLLFCVCAYFLIILPLPSREVVAMKTGPTCQLVPFNVIKVFKNESGFILRDPSTYLKAFTSHAFLQPAFNFLLILPLGVYLRYYFKVKALKAARISFLTTLFFELTQFSGLYGIYPRPYRLLDVDDLMLNFSGSMFGYFIAPLIVFILPSRSQIDAKAYRLGQNVTIMRRVLAKIIDTLVVSIFFSIFVIYIYTGFKISSININIKMNSELVKWLLCTYIITSILYHVMSIVFVKGCTVGKYILGIRICDYRDKKISKLRILYRYLLYLIITYVVPLGAIYIYYKYLLNNIITAIIFGILLLLTILYSIIRIFISIFSTKYTFFSYEKMSSTCLRAINFR